MQAEETNTQPQHYFTGRVLWVSELGPTNKRGPRYKVTDGHNTRMYYIADHAGAFDCVLSFVRSVDSWRHLPDDAQFVSGYQDGKGVNVYTVIDPVYGASLTVDTNRSREIFNRGTVTTYENGRQVTRQL